ncbi:MAG: hypothetical protein JSW14_06600 [Candidatus Bathyarchaeum sp.]|nr:MAG: hypothetical protein JSW14_06600 [Candidatus Bathyarchaeum sp.]
MEYPSEKILGEIAQLIFSDYNSPPDGHVVWWLSYDKKVEKYWVDVIDGSIIFVWVPRLGGPTKGPTDTSDITNTIIYTIIPAVVIVAIAVAAVLVFKRKKRAEQ